MSMRLVIGLGNPGSRYFSTRHNVGYIFVDEFQKVARSRKQVAGREQIKILKSNKFMNESGEFVSELCTKYSVLSTNLYVVHDDLDIPLGDFKIQLGKGPKDHNGLKSIDEALGTDQYWHVRIGIDNRPLDGRPMGEEYVLQNFSDDEKQILDRTIKQACKKLKTQLNSK